jgi:hypothetical protein
MPEEGGKAAQKGGAEGFKAEKEGGEVEAGLGGGEGRGDAVKVEGPRRLKRGVGEKGEGEGDGEGEGEKNVRPIKSNNNQLEQEKAEVWHERLEELKTFMQVHNHDHVVRGESGNTHGKLELWVAKQRCAFANRLLPLDRVRRLNSIGFHWKGSEARKQMAAVAAGGEGCVRAPGVQGVVEAGDSNKKENGVRGARWAGSSRVAGKGGGGDEGGGAETRERQERSTRGIIDRYTPPKKPLPSSEDRFNPLKKRRLGVEDCGREGREGCGRDGGVEAGGMNGAKRTVEECVGGGGGGGEWREREFGGRKDVASRGLGDGEGGNGGGGDTGGAGYRRQKRKATEIIIHEKARGHGPISKKKVKVLLHFCCKITILTFQIWEAGGVKVEGLAEERGRGSRRRIGEEKGGKEGAGWEEGGGGDEAWRVKFDLLLLFRSLNGHSHMGQDEPLSSWVAEQRRAFKEGKLSESQVQMLLDAEFEFDAKFAQRRLAIIQTQSHPTAAGARASVEGRGIHGRVQAREEAREEGMEGVSEDPPGGGGRGLDNLEDMACPVCSSKDHEESMILCDKCGQVYIYMNM